MTGNANEHHRARLKALRQPASPPAINQTINELPQKKGNLSEADLPSTRETYLLAGPAFPTASTASANPIST
jgi:hypothetical protein